MIGLLVLSLCIAPGVRVAAATPAERAKATVVERARTPTAEDLSRLNALASDPARGIAVGDSRTDINTGVANIVDGTRMLQASHARGDDFGIVLAVIIIAGGVAIVIVATSGGVSIHGSGCKALYVPTYYNSYPPGYVP